MCNLYWFFYTHKRNRKIWLSPSRCACNVWRENVSLWRGESQLVQPKRSSHRNQGGRFLYCVKLWINALQPSMERSISWTILSLTSLCLHLMSTSCLRAVDCMVDYSTFTWLGNDFFLWNLVFRIGIIIVFGNIKLKHCLQMPLSFRLAI